MDFGGTTSEESSPAYQGNITQPSAPVNPDSWSGGGGGWGYWPGDTYYDGTDGGGDYGSSSYSYTPPQVNFNNMDTTNAGDMAEGGSFMDSSFGKRLRNFLTVNKGSTAYNWGLRTPGSEEARNFFGTETPGERDIRMGNVGQTLGTLGNLFMPAPVKMGMAAYNTYQKGGGFGDYMKALAPGLPGNLGKAVNTGLSISDGNYGRAFQTAVGGLPGTAGGLAIDAAQGRDVTAPVAQTVGRYLGNEVAGPMGGATGSFLANQLFQQQTPRQQIPSEMGPTTQPTVQGISDQNSTYNTLGQVFGAYNNYRQSKAAEESAASMKANLPDLNAMFGPGSAAYKNLERELNAKDAASGRRSQYGTRAVELAARMATLQGQYGASFANANMNAEQMALKARQESMSREAQMLNNLFQVGKNMGAPQYLNQMFSGSGGGGGSPSFSGMPSTSGSDKPYLYGDDYYG